MIKNTSDLALSDTLPGSCCFNHSPALSSAGALCVSELGSVSSKRHFRVPQIPNQAAPDLYRFIAPHLQLRYSSLNSRLDPSTLTTQGLFVLVVCMYSTAPVIPIFQSKKAEHFQKGALKLPYTDVYHG